MHALSLPFQFQRSIISVSFFRDINCRDAEIQHCRANVNYIRREMRFAASKINFAGMTSLIAARGKDIKYK